MKTALANQQVLDCRYGGMDPPALIWSRTLPLIKNEINIDLLRTLRKYYGVFPAALRACPPSLQEVYQFEYRR